MREKVKKIIWLNVYRYQDMTLRLEKMAAKGLFLETCGPYLWTFRKGAPKNLHYAVTYFSEGSQFNPGITDNQQLYFDYAQAAGWSFVAQYHQMQIFCNAAAHPIPFETDEREKFENIKKCMRKSFLPSISVVLLILSLNLFMLLHSLQSNPIDFLSDVIGLLSFVILFTAVLYFIYMLLDYILWCRRSARSIAAGGACAEKTGRLRPMIDRCYACVIFGCLGWYLLYLATEKNWLFLFGITQMPILMLVFWVSNR